MQISCKIFTLTEELIMAAIAFMADLSAKSRACATHDTFPLINTGFTPVFVRVFVILRPSELCRRELILLARLIITDYMMLAGGYPAEKNLLSGRLEITTPPCKTPQVTETTSTVNHILSPPL